MTDTKPDADAVRERLRAAKKGQAPHYAVSLATKVLIDDALALLDAQADADANAKLWHDRYMSAVKQNDAQAQQIARLTAALAESCDEARMEHQACPFAAECDAQRRGELAELVAAQAEDAGLWFQAEYASEAYLQQHLRALHRAVEALLRGDTKFGWSVTRY